MSERDERNRAVTELHELRRQLTRAYGVVTHRFYPTGGPIEWWRGGRAVNHFQKGTVVRHGDDGRMQVRNSETGKTYWISIWDTRVEKP